MLLSKKAQSTAEYAITIGIVVAVVAGVMSVALKGGMRQKVTQATDLLKTTGTSTGVVSGLKGGDNEELMAATGTLHQADDTNFTVYEGDARHTTVNKQDSESILKKGGAMVSNSSSESQTSTFNYEAYNAVHGGQ